MVEIEGSQVKVLVDSGACETLIASSWVEHLGIKKRMRKEEAPEGLRGVSGEEIEIIGAIVLSIRIGKKRVQWKTWVVKGMMIPMILGNDFHDEKTIIDYKTHMWEYEGEKIPFNIEKRVNGGNNVSMVVAVDKMRIPQYTAMRGRGKIIGEEREAKGRLVEFTGVIWREVRARTETGVVDTYIRKDMTGKGDRGSEDRMCEHGGSTYNNKEGRYHRICGGR